MSPHRPTAGLCLEPLEDRTSPAVIFSHGGPVIAHVEINNLYVGSAPNEDALSQVIATDYMRMLSPYYGVGAGGFRSSTALPNLGTFVSDYSGSLGQLSELQALIVADMLLGRVPLPDSSEVYVVHLAPGEHVQAPWGRWDLGDFAGYHSTMFLGPLAIPYAVVLDQGDAARDGEVLSHEVAEAATDPIVNGITGQQTGYATAWPGWEIGDIYAWQPWLLDGYTVQMLAGPNLERLESVPG